MKPCDVCGATVGDHMPGCAAVRLERKVAELPKGAVKYDDGKIDLTLAIEYFPRALTAIAAVSQYGIRKYGIRGGWREVPDGIRRYGAAFLRHHFGYAMGIAYDEESGLAHLAQRCWNDLAVLERSIEEGLVEIRSGNDIVDGKPVPGTSKKIA